MLANFAVMAGLLGTITGMIKSFGSVGSDEGGNKATELAEGISEALELHRVRHRHVADRPARLLAPPGQDHARHRRHQRGDRPGRQPRDVAPLADAAPGVARSSHRFTPQRGGLTMGAAVGTDEKGSVNVELNIVPFIDLMSCLTAFLLVTAVWVNIAQIKIQPKGKTRDTSNVQTGRRDRHAVGARPGRSRSGSACRASTSSRRSRRRPDGDQDWEKFETHAQGAQGLGVLRRSQRTSRSRRRATTQRPVKYQDVIRAMDLAIKVGFIDVGLSDPAGLAARPSL